MIHAADRTRSISMFGSDGPNEMRMLRYMNLHANGHWLRTISSAKFRRWLDREALRARFEAALETRSGERLLGLLDWYKKDHETYWAKFFRDLLA